MATPWRVATRPHPVLLVLPIGLWIISLICDVVHATSWGRPIWNDLAFFTMTGGVAAALLAEGASFVAFLPLTGRSRSIGLAHLLINLGLVGLYSANVFLRTSDALGALVPVALSGLGVVLLGISGWLGGELAYVHSVSVASYADVAARRPRKAA
jgi:uncharacterized membrane protein